MSVLPPLGGQAPPLQCNRLLNGDFAHPEHCGKPGTWHVIWTSDMENGIACNAHMDEIRAKWAFYAAHLYRTECSMPGAVYVEAENRCVVDEDGLGRPVDELAASRELVDATDSRD